MRPRTPDIDTPAIQAYRTSPAPPQSRRVASGYPPCLFGSTLLIVAFARTVKDRLLILAGKPRIPGKRAGNPLGIHGRITNPSYAFEGSLSHQEADRGTVRQSDRLVLGLQVIRLRSRGHGGVRVAAFRESEISPWATDGGPNGQ